MSKIKVLVYADSPTVKTGFGTVSRNVLEALYKTGKYDIDCFGINYHGTPHQFPFNIWPAIDYQSGDPYGRSKFEHFARQHPFDILWILQDTFIVNFLPNLIKGLRAGRPKPFRSIMYYPVDSIIKPEWYNSIAEVDKLVAYTEFGKQEVLQYTNRSDIDVIYHGVNLDEFHPLPAAEAAAFRKQYFGSLHDKFIFMNVNRNQQRKDIPRTIQAFKEFRKHRPDSILYLHMAMRDQGWDLPELCKRFDLSVKDDVVFPENFEPNQAYPVQILNMLYNCADCIISTTLGEGFGLGWVEAMACGIPTISPRNTAMAELITEDRGYLIDNGNNPSLWTCLPHDNEVMRPLVDVEDMVKKMIHVYDNREEAKNKAANAYNWVTKELPWSGKITKQWVKVFDDAVNSLRSNTFTDISGKAIKTEAF